ncbi:testis-expressed protein 15 [Morus bassanus]
MLSAKAAFTKACASAAPRASFFGPEHIFFEAAKSLVGKDRRMSFEKAAEEEKSQLLFKLDQEALSKPGEDCQLKTGKPHSRMDKKHRKLQTRMVTRREHSETLKKYFQILQEEGVSTLLIADKNMLGTLCEMVRFLKNSIAKKVGAERFRSLLSFDLSLLRELLHCEEQMASFSLLKDHSRETLGRTVALAVSGSQRDHNGFMGLLGCLKSAARKDLGEMAHIVRMMNTIEHRKLLRAREGHLVLLLPVHQMLRNWRKIHLCEIRGTVAARLPSSRGGVSESQTSACNLKLLSCPPGSRDARRLPHRYSFTHFSHRSKAMSRASCASFLPVRPGISEDVASSSKSMIRRGPCRYASNLQHPLGFCTVEDVRRGARSSTPRRVFFSLHQARSQHPDWSIAPQAPAFINFLSARLFSFSCRGVC